jgi:chromosome segregation ATPase
MNHRWEQLEQTVQQIQEQQSEDFRLVMIAMAQTRDGLAQTQAGLVQMQEGLVETNQALGRVETGLVRYTEQTGQQLELLRSALRDSGQDIEARLDEIDRRLDQLEKPAA